MVMVDDYTYVVLDFRGDPELVLPEGSQWGNIGKYIFFYNVFVILKYVTFLSSLSND
jgi:hypothetical protein